MMSYMFTKAKYYLGCGIVSVMISCNSHSSASNEESTEERSAKITDTTSTQQTITTPAATEPVKDDTARTHDFQKTLYFMNTSFNVTATGKGSLQYLTIQPHGLSHNKMITIENVEPVVNAEVADLNNDGYAELLIYTQSAGSGSYGNVYAYSVNNGQSLSAVQFPKVVSNGDMRKQYGGHDQFAIVNNRLVQRFPLYNPADPNSRPTGRQRTITYKLINGEASRRFIIDKVSEE